MMLPLYYYLEPNGVLVVFGNIFIIYLLNKEWSDPGACSYLYRNLYSPS